MERPKWLLEVPAAEYYEATKNNLYMTSHRLNTFRKCPLELKQVMDGVIVRKDTANFELGRATHTLIIEGMERFDQEYEVADGPVNPKTGTPYGKTTKAYTEWAAAQAKPVVGSEDFTLIQKLRDSVMVHEVARRLLAEGFAEATVRVEWNGVSFQTRMDWFNPETGDLVDLKTCADVDKFKYDIRDFGYKYQLACYARGLQLSGYERQIRPWLIAVEKKEPYRCMVIEISAATLSACSESQFNEDGQRIDNEAMMAEYAECRQTDRWPTRYETAILI